VATVTKKHGKGILLGGEEYRLKRGILGLYPDQTKIYVGSRENTYTSMLGLSPNTSGEKDSTLKFRKGTRGEGAYAIWYELHKSLAKECIGHLEPCWGKKPSRNNQIREGSRHN